MRWEGERVAKRHSQAEREGGAGVGPEGVLAEPSGVATGVEEDHHVAAGKTLIAEELQLRGMAEGISQARAGEGAQQGEFLDFVGLSDKRPEPDELLFSRSRDTLFVRVFISCTCQLSLFAKPG